MKVTVRNSFSVTGTEFAADASIVTLVLFRVAGSKVVTGAQRQARILTGFVWIS